MVHILFHKQHKKPVEGTAIEIYIYINIHTPKQHSVFLSSFPLEDAAACRGGLKSPAKWDGVWAIAAHHKLSGKLNKNLKVHSCLRHSLCIIPVTRSLCCTAVVHGGHGGGGGRSRGTARAPGQILGSSNTWWFSHWFVRPRQRQRERTMGVHPGVDFTGARPPSLRVSVAHFQLFRRRTCRFSTLWEEGVVSFLRRYFWKKWDRRHPARGFGKVIRNVADALESELSSGKRHRRRDNEWINAARLAAGFGRSKTSLFEINAWQSTSLARK